MELFNGYNLLQANTISVLRNYPRFLTLLKCIGFRFDNLQECINYLCENTKLDQAEGVWLDCIGWLVGQTRSEYIDNSQYFCVNETHQVEGEPAGDINRSIRFYFPSISSNSGSATSLDDGLFYKQIKAKIAYNISNGTREDYIRIIKPLVNADKVIIENYAPMLLEITLYGNNIIKKDIRERIESVLQDGMGIHGDITIFEDISYESIEEQINTIVEMTGIEGDYENYGYIEINDDLDYILAEDE